MFPAFFRVEGRMAAVFGNGDEAFAKVRLLLNTQIRIVAYAEAPEADYHAFLIANRISLVRGPLFVRAGRGRDAGVCGNGRCGG